MELKCDSVYGGSNCVQTVNVEPVNEMSNENCGGISIGKNDLEFLHNMHTRLSKNRIREAYGGVIKSHSKKVATRKFLIEMLLQSDEIL